MEETSQDDTDPEVREKIRYFLDKAKKRGLDHASCIKFASYNLARWMRANRPDVKLEME